MIIRQETQDVKRPSSQPFWGFVLYSLSFTFAIEVLSRRSLQDAIWFVISKPACFFCNMLPMLLALCVTFFIKRRAFGVTIVSVFFGILGIANGVIRILRLTPLEAADFLMLKTALSIVHMYLSVFEILLIALLILAMIAVLIWVYRKSPVKTRQVKTGIKTVVCMGILTFSAISAYSYSIPENGFANLAGAYDEYGFIYSFGNSVFNQGISEPDNYTPESIDDILETLSGTIEGEPQRKPNIIFLQLESFFDVTKLAGITYSETPTPVFNTLKATCSSGTLSVPSLGGGTVNTEFEVLTGMNLEDFGAGEYPYKTFLKDTPCESLAWNLSECGYAAHAIHNNTAMFYDRYNVYPMLGFDTFTSVEYMLDVEQTPLGWSKDEILVDEILKTLDSTVEQDFIWTIAVQSHGGYPTEPVEGMTSTIAVNGLEDEEQRYAFEYYVNQLHEVDGVLSRLVTVLSQRKEETVLVVYGDHLPAIDSLETLVETGEAYETEYVIWSNFPMEAKDRDLSTYQLGAEVLSRLGIENGILNKLHQRYSDHTEYAATLELLEYDMLYGEHNIYGGVIPYTPKQMKMGISQIHIDGISYEDQNLTVRGYGFTPYSQITVDNELAETLYVSENELQVLNVEIEPEQTIRVAQVGNGAILSQTDGIMLP